MRNNSDVSVPHLVQWLRPEKKSITQLQTCEAETENLGGHMPGHSRGQSLSKLITFHILCRQFWPSHPIAYFCSLLIQFH